MVGLPPIILLEIHPQINWRGRLECVFKIGVRVAESVCHPREFLRSMGMLSYLIFGVTDAFAAARLFFSISPTALTRTGVTLIRSSRRPSDSPTAESR